MIVRGSACTGHTSATVTQQTLRCNTLCTVSTLLHSGESAANAAGASMQAPTRFHRVAEDSVAGDEALLSLAFFLSGPLSLPRLPLTLFSIV